MGRAEEAEATSNVVIVGGSDETRLVLRGLLRLHQHRVLGEARAPEAAFDLLAKAPDPVLLLDAEVDQPSWTDFVSEARRRYPAARIVLLTGSRSARVDSQAKALGVSALVRRPFAIQELLNAVGPGPTSAPPPPPSPPAPSSVPSSTPPGPAERSP